MSRRVSELKSIRGTYGLILNRDLVSTTLLGWFSISTVLLRGPSTSKLLDCPGLFNASTVLIPGLSPYIASVYDLRLLSTRWSLTLLSVSHPANVTFSTPDASPSYPQPVPDLPEFCRFGAEFNTSKISKVRFEVWLPKLDHWNGVFKRGYPT